MLHGQLLVIRKGSKFFGSYCTLRISRSTTHNEGTFHFICDILY